ncbi:hypothetical protein OEA41_007549 [Lepraria neglecta]|uniref:Uncharacterized protein n=1 Tax=Lepraria neglecta TaxID=209136 RepID=A0AAD9ZD97_9LECA|nr:hypothetical protein OEA41_007549 [Lepraria neglecta]
MTMKKFMPSGDANRLEGLLTAFYIPPNFTRGYTIAQSGLLRALESIKDASIASFPAKIYCGSQTTTPDDPNPRSKFVKYEKDPKTGLPYMKDNKLSFAYQDRF